MLPAVALQQGLWFKLICGASFHHLPSIRNLALIYTMARADCIDVAADPAIVQAAVQGMRMARHLAPVMADPAHSGTESPLPWLMCSFNDGADPHFRKAVVETSCPTTCPQPCVQVCPPNAIASLVGESLGQETSGQALGVRIQADLCYGCGRCEPICPHRLIQTAGFQVPVSEVLPKLLSVGIQAIEIHTQVGRIREFQHLWQRLRYWVPQLELVSISVGEGEGLQAYLEALVEAMDPFPQRLVWQTDGRPMSGDLGAGSTRAVLQLAQRVAAMRLPGYVQLAGGTNQFTVEKARQLNIPMAGVAYGSYARQLVSEAAELPFLESHPEILRVAVEQASQLVRQVKAPSEAKF